MSQQLYQSSVIIVISIWLFACSEPLPAEKQIALVMEKMQAAADEKRLIDLMMPFHASFLGKQNMRKQDLQGRIFFHFRINPKVRVFVNNAEIQVDGEDAEVSCHLLVTGSQKQLPDRGRFYRVTSSWKKFDDEWMVVEAEWEDVVQDVIEELAD